LLLFVLPLGVQAEAKGISWEKVSLLVEPARPSFVVGEPVTLVVRLTNTGKEPVAFSTADLGVEHETAAIRIVAPDGKEIEYRTWFVREPSAPSFALGPGDSKSFSQTLHWDAGTDRYAFPLPGTYRISVLIHNLTGEKDLKSEATSVRVLEAKATGDRKLQRLMTDRKVAGVLAGVTEPDKDLLSRLQGAVEADPQGRFAPYIHHALGLYYSREYFERKPNLEEARKHFKQALKLGGPQYPLRVKLLGSIARQAVRAGDIREAKQMLQDANEVRNDDLEVLQLKKIIEKRTAQ
jgi:hypothetical protein